MASYVGLTKSMDVVEKQAKKLAEESTIKDIVAILNDKQRTPAELKVASKAMELTAAAAQNFENEAEMTQPQGDLGLEELAKKLFGGAFGEE
nr:MAG TPA: hypothetical protein [Caudoviricetes sp.]